MIDSYIEEEHLNNLRKIKFDILNRKKPNVISHHNREQHQSQSGNYKTITRENSAKMRNVNNFRFQSPQLNNDDKKKNYQIEIPRVFDRDND